MANPAARLFVGALFAVRDDLDAAVNAWALQHATNLAVRAVPEEHTVRRWVCQSWIAPGLGCQYRDCVLEIEAAYLPTLGCW